MKAYIICFLSICAVAFSTGCKHPQGSPGMTPSSAQRIYKLPYEQVYGAALAVVTEDLKMPVMEAFSETGVVSTDWIRYERKAGDYQDADRKGITRYSPITVEYKLIVLVKITPEGVMVRARKYEREFKERWYAVPTDLMFERQFLDMVSLRLGIAGQQ